MRAHTTPWRSVPLADDYGRPARATWRGLDWAGYEHDLAVAGSRLHYLDYTAGHHPGGDVFVLAHGLGGRWQHWSQNIPALGQRGRVIAVDLPGFGRSRPLPGRYSIEAFADAIAELCRQLRLPPAVFLGHSLGGPLAVRFATRHPALARAIVLVAGTVDVFAETLGGRRLGRNLRRHPQTVASTCFEVLTAALPAPGVLRRQISRRPALRRLLLWPYLHRPAALPADRVAVLLDGAGARGVLPTALAVGRLRPGESLGQLRCPVMAIGADHDAISPLSDLRAFAEALPTARTVVLEGTGHMLMLERPDAFNAEVTGFLDHLPRAGETAPPLIRLPHPAPRRAQQDRPGPRRGMPGSDSTP
jgi:pimeloyl-ACP methyl ester carboxylesterase